MHTCQARILNELSVVLGIYAPCGAQAGAVAVCPAVMQVSATMSLFVLRHAMSGCLFLHRSQVHVPLMT